MVRRPRGRDRRGTGASALLPSTPLGGGDPPRRTGGPPRLSPEGPLAGHLGSGRGSPVASGITLAAAGVSAWVLGRRRPGHRWCLREAWIADAHAHRVHLARSRFRTTPGACLVDDGVGGIPEGD